MTVGGIGGLKGEKEILVKLNNFQFEFHFPKVGNDLLQTARGVVTVFLFIL